MTRPLGGYAPEQRGQIVPVTAVRETNELSSDAAEHASCGFAFSERIGTIAYDRVPAYQERSAARDAASGMLNGIAKSCIGRVGSANGLVIVAPGAVMKHVL
jgi:hypothetical protein